MVLEILNTVITAAIPVLIFYFGYRIERQKRMEREAKQKEQDAIERKHKARIQFELGATLFGPQEGYYIADLAAILDNKGLVRNVIYELHLKVLGIKNDSPLELFDKENSTGNLDTIVNFPVELVDTDMLQKKDKKDGYFVEPGVRQVFTYVTMISEQISFLLVMASFKYHASSKHTVARVFKVSTHQNDKNIESE